MVQSELQQMTTMDNKQTNNNIVENEPITITVDDIKEANQLSLHCPICASAVERESEHPALMPVVCETCNTLYHKACWEQSGGTCAILGCNSKEYHPYGHETGAILKITQADLPKVGRPRPSLNGQQKRIKAEERRRARQQYPWWARWFLNLLRAIKILDE